MNYFYCCFIFYDSLMDKKRLDEIDSQKMYEVYDDWPNIAKLYYEKDPQKVNFSGIDHVVFAGMGGSGALGDVFSAILSKTDVHVCVVKGYHLPKTVDSNTLVVVPNLHREHFLRHAQRGSVAPKFRYRSAPNDRTVTYGTGHWQSIACVRDGPDLPGPWTLGV